MENNSSTLLVDIIGVAVTVSLVGATIGSLCTMFDEEEFDLRDNFKDILMSALAFVIFFTISGETINFLHAIAAGGAGLIIGYLTTFPVKLYRQKISWYTRGTMIFLAVWSLIFTISQLSEYFFDDLLPWWWLSLAVFSLSAMMGSLAHLFQRQRAYRQTK